MVKIDHMIWTYLLMLPQLTIYLLNQCFYGLTHRLKIAKSSINSNQWICESKWFEIFHFSAYTLKWFGGFFWRASGHFPAFNTSLKFVFLVQYFATFLFGFCVWFFKMELICFATFTEYRIYNHWIGLFCSVEHLGAKICRFLTFSTRWRCLLNRRRQRVKTL